MFNVSGATATLGLDAQLFKSPSISKDKVFIDDPYTDKVSLSSGQQEPELTYEHLAKNTNNVQATAEETSEKSKEKNDPLKEPDRLATMMQQVLDAKLGVDRKKLEEIEDKIKALTEKEGELNEADKAQLEMLQKQKEQLIKEGAKKLTEAES
ncbi:MAG: hypothetical protein K2W88_04180 [Pararheinheimera sp.]|nr:hypothetical protein [Rheinheimera sp.]